MLCRIYFLKLVWSVQNFGLVSRFFFVLFPIIYFYPLVAPWKENKNRRLLFEDYAKQNGFDPLHPENWYLQPKHKVMAIKAIYQVIEHYNYNLPKALTSVFPEIGLNSSKLFM